MKRNQSNLVPRLALGICSILSLMALPGYAGYQKPGNAGVSGDAAGISGVRECGELVALAPQQHVGQTVSSHPTFVWFIPPGSEANGELQLYERTDTGAFRELLDGPHQFPTTSGTVTFSLPETLAGLQLETEYIWQVLVRCSARPSSTYIVRSQIEVMDGIERLPNTLSSNLLERADQLAEAGLWYDAMAIVANEPTCSPAGALRNELLLNLADLEASDIDSQDADYYESLYLVDKLKQLATRDHCQSPANTNADQ